MRSHSKSPVLQAVSWIESVTREPESDEEFDVERIVLRYEGAIEEVEKKFGLKVRKEADKILQKRAVLFLSRS